MESLNVFQFEYCQAGHICELWTKAGDLMLEYLTELAIGRSGLECQPAGGVML